MTLLIGTRSSGRLILSADGLSTLNRGGITSVNGERLQKIFPASFPGLAIVHHGENILNGQPIDFLVPQFLSQFGKLPSQEEVLARLREFFNPLIKETLMAKPDAHKCGFWCCTFEESIHHDPQIVLVEWAKEGGTVGEPSRSSGNGGDLVMSGSGHGSISEYTKIEIDGQFDYRKLFKGSEQFNLRFHKKLWTIAKERQAIVGKVLFGGHRHVLVMTPSQNKWESPPLQP